MDDSSVKTKSDKIYQAILIVILLIFALCAILPFLMLLSSSFTEEATLAQSGYNFFPRKFSAYAYEYLFKSNGAKVWKAYGITFFVTIVGTAFSLLIGPMLGWVLSRKDYKRGKVLTFMVFFTMLFNGGLVPTYLMYADTFHIKNTIWALILPNLLVRAYYIMLMRSYFLNNLPGEVLEAASIDGATEFQIFGKVAIPMSKPIIATVLMFSMILYWNDWQNGLYYITTKTNLYTIQNLLNRMIQEIQFLSNNAVVGQSTSTANIPSATVRMAIAVVGILPIAIVYPFVQKNFAKGITLGAVKG